MAERDAKNPSRTEQLSDLTWSLRLTAVIFAALLIFAATCFVGQRAQERFKPNFPDARLVFCYSTGGHSSSTLNISSETTVDGINFSTKSLGPTTVHYEGRGAVAYEFRLIAANEEGDKYLVTIQENGATCFQDHVTMTGEAVPLVRLCDDWLELSLYPSQASVTALANAAPGQK